MTSTVEDENHPNYSLRVNLEPLIDVASQDQVTAGFVYLNHIIRDMIDYKTPAAKQLLRYIFLNLSKQSPFRPLLTYTHDTAAI